MDRYSHGERGSVDSHGYWLGTGGETSRALKATRNPVFGSIETGIIEFPVHVRSMEGVVFLREIPRRIAVLIL